MENLGIILDLACLVFVIISIVVGRAKGMVKMLRGVLVPLLAVLCAILLNATVTPIIEEQHFFGKIEDKVSTIVIEKLPSLPASGTQGLSAEQRTDLEKLLAPFGVELDDALGAVEEGRTQAPVTTSKQTAWQPFIDTICHAIAKAMAYVFVFLGVMLVLQILFYLLGLVFRLPVLKGINRTVGTLLGAAKGILIVMFLSFFLHKMGTTLYAVSPTLCEGIHDSHIISALGNWLSARL